jgi:hypothetical protein
MLTKWIPKKMKRFFEDQIDSIKDKIDSVKAFFKNVKRASQWLPIIWKDRDYDYWFLFELMEYKLDRMEKSIGNAPFVGNKGRAKEIKEVRKLLRSILNTEFDNKAMEELDKKWGKIRCFKSEPIFNPEPRLNGAIEIKMYREKEKTEKDTKRLHKDMKRIYGKYEKQEEEAMKKALDIILKKHKGWWW